MRARFILASVFFGFGSAVALAAIDPTVLSGNVLKIGATAPLTGPTLALGTAIIHGTQAYLKHFNDAGGADGIKIELIALDDGYEPDRAIVNYSKLIKEDGVMALASVFGGPTTAALIPLAERDGVPMLGPLSSANISSPVRKNVFAVRPNAYHESEALVAHLIDDLGIRDIAVFYQDDAFGTAGKSGVEKALNQRGLQLKGKGSYKRNSIDVADAVEEISKAKPKAILIFGLYPASAEFVKKYAEKVASPIFAGPAGMASAPFFKDTAQIKTDFFAAMPHPLVDDPSDPLIKMYREDMKSAGFSDINQYGVDGYLNGMLLGELLKRKGKKLTRESFRETLETFGDTTFGGVKVTFSPTDHQGIKAAYLAKYKNGKMISVKNFKD